MNLYVSKDLYADKYAMRRYLNKKINECNKGKPYTDDEIDKHFHVSMLREIAKLPNALLIEVSVLRLRPIVDLTDGNDKQ